MDSTEEKKEVRYIADETNFSQKLKPDQGVKPDTLFLFGSVFVVQILIIVSGTTIVWTSPVIPKLLSNDTEINPLGKPATTTDISLIAGTPILVSLIGSLALPRLADVFGRKILLLMMAVGVFISHILVAFSNSVIMIVISRCILGTFLTACFSIVPIYITEICEDHNRAKYGCYLGLFHQFGHFYCFIIGPYFSMKVLTLLLAAPMIPCLIGFLFLPETPPFLQSKGKEEECKKALKQLRSNKDTVELQNDYYKLVENNKMKASARKSPSYMSLLTNRVTRIGFMLALLPFMVQILSGVVIIMAFLAPFFNSAGTTISGHHVAIIVGILKMSCYFFTSFVVERLGRKRMLLFSAVGAGLPLFFLGCFFYLKYINSPWINKLQWLPLPLLLCNVCMYALGIGPIPVAIMHEMFPAEYRALAGGLIMTIANTLVFAMTFSYPIIAATIGTHWAVWAFSVCCLLGALLIHIFLPETKGKSLLEIQEILKKY